MILTLPEFLARMPLGWLVPLRQASRDLYSECNKEFQVRGQKIKQLLGARTLLVPEPTLASLRALLDQSEWARATHPPSSGDEYLFPPECCLLRAGMRGNRWLIKYCYRKLVLPHRGTLQLEYWQDHLLFGLILSDRLTLAKELVSPEVYDFFHGYRRSQLLKLTGEISSELADYVGSKGYVHVIDYLCRKISTHHPINAILVTPILAGALKASNWHVIRHLLQEPWWLVLSCNIQKGLEEIINNNTELLDIMTPIGGLFN